MERAHEEAEWWRLSHLLSKIHNQHVTEKAHLTTSLDFYPFADRHRDRLDALSPTESIDYLSALLIPKP